MRRRGNQQRNARGYHQPPIEVREPAMRFLIVCEGEETERNYFEKFGVPRKLVLDVIGTGFNTLSLVEEAIRLKASEEYLQVWCVFDKDEFPPEHFREAIRLAAKNDVRTAYSNQAFELWFLLHFDYCDSDLHRSEFKAKLGQRLGRPYRKNDRSIFETLEPKMQTAIDHARKLHQSYEPHSPKKDSPCTLVYLLVEELQRYAR